MAISSIAHRDASSPNLSSSASKSEHEHRPKLSFWQIWNMSFGFLGIQFGFALQGGYMSRIFQTLGADKDQIPMLWIAAPLTGLLVQPIIGYLSDRTWNVRLGRRRPFFFGGSCFEFLGFVLGAVFFGALDGRWVFVGFGCVHQHIHGALSGLGR